MISIDSNRLINDRNYRILVRECHSIIAYIATKLNIYDTISSTSVKFNKTSELYNIKDELVQMLKEMFPLFEVTIEKCSNNYDLDEDEFIIRVAWQNYKSKLLEK